MLSDKHRYYLQTMGVDLYEKRQQRATTVNEVEAASKVTSLDDVKALLKRAGRSQASEALDNSSNVDTAHSINTPQQSTQQSMQQSTQQSTHITPPPITPTETTLPPIQLPSLVISDMQIMLSEMFKGEIAVAHVPQVELTHERLLIPLQFVDPVLDKRSIYRQIVSLFS